MNHLSGSAVRSDQHPLPPAPSRSALVLGGGGSAGNAWLIGVVAGLLDGGLDATAADLIIGTSAGATAAAQMTTASPSALYEAILSSSPPPRPRAAPARSPHPTGRTVADHMERTRRIIDASADAADLRRRMGAAAIELAVANGSSGRDRWREIVAARLPHSRWPQRAMVLTAVDARTGEAVLFDRSSGVELVDAVAASCASGFAYRIGDGEYIDGGYRANAENADLAAGYARVLVLAPFGGRSRTPESWGTQLSAQLDLLRDGGSAVETIFPDRAAVEAFGENVMNPATRLPAARAGHAQGQALACGLTDFWIGG